jgi:hypothetical protein
MKSHLRRFVPRLQFLDERTVPAVTFELKGTFLFVTGDAGTNQITITDSGTDAGITVSAFTVEDAEEKTYIAPSMITHIFVDVGLGNDTVTYNLTAPLSGNRLVDAQLGRGSDVYTANISGKSLGANVQLDLSVNGQGGKDTLILNAQLVSTGAGSILNVFFGGDAGKDTITFDYTAADEKGKIFLVKDQRR